MRRLPVTSALLLTFAFAGSAHAQVPAPPSCSAGDLPETGIQGQVPLADQLDGRAMMGYSCNLKVVGASTAPLTQGLPSSGAAAYSGSCAYLQTVRGSLLDSGLGGTDVSLRGAVVVQDFSDVSHPVDTAQLDTPAMQDSWESMKVNDARGLLGAVGIQGDSFDLYDVSKDCRHPQLLSSLTLPDGYGHGGQFSPDGRFYYATDPPSLLGDRPQPERVQVIDLSDVHHPKLVLSWVPSSDTYVHDVALSADGNRAYFVTNGVGEGSPGNSIGVGRNGLLVMDTSQIEAGVKDPKISVIGEVHWHDTNGAGQMPALARIGGKPYVIVTDEAGNLNNTATSCPMGTPPGYPRLISLADETHPAIVSTLGLQVDLTDNCAKVLDDHQNYTSHYCTVDDPSNATVVACTYWASGLRVFDIRDPAHPREIAYFNPPPAVTPTLNWSTSGVRFLRDKGELWFNSELNGVDIVKFEPGTYPLPALASAGAGACASRRTVVFHLPARVTRVRVTVDGHTVKATRHGRTLRLSLAGRTRSTVRVRLTGSRGYTRTSVLHPCSRRS